VTSLSTFEHLLCQCVRVYVYRFVFWCVIVCECVYMLLGTKFFLLTGLETKIKGLKKIAVKHNIQMKRASVCV